MAEAVTNSADSDPHFIGWQPMPSVFVRYLAPIAIGLVIAAAALAILRGLAQPSPGNARWNDDQNQTLVGIVYAEPYAMIRVAGERPDDPIVTMLLVGDGKFGVQDRIRPFDRQPVQITGTLLSRVGWRMMELSSGNDGIRMAKLSEEEQAALRRAPQDVLSGPRDSVQLRGEILDSKCYLGAMKPGNGRTHRGCALLCLRGGVPPLFVSRNEGAEPTIYLLASESRGPVDPAVLEQAGLPVTVEGTVDQQPGLPVLRLAPNGVRVD